MLTEIYTDFLYLTHMGMTKIKIKNLLILVASHTGGNILKKISHKFFTQLLVLLTKSTFPVVLELTFMSFTLLFYTSTWD